MFRNTDRAQRGWSLLHDVAERGGPLLEDLSWGARIFRRLVPSHIVRWLVLAETPTQGLSMWPIQQNQVTKLVHVQVKKKQALLFVGSLSKNLWTRFKTTPLYSCSWGLLLPAMLYNIISPY